MMGVSRRNFMLGGAALPLATSLPRRLHAQTQLGTARLTSVSDGYLTLPANLIFEPMPKDALQPILAEFDLNAEQLKPECNLALYQDGTRTVLFDVGSGADFMPSAGSLLDSLDALGLAPTDITDVVMTHAHPDHIWGLLDDFDDPTFPDATYYMGAVEWDYWWDPKTVDRIGEARAVFAVGARRRMEYIEDSVVRFGPGEEILPGIAAVASPGHTPGHMSFEVRNGTDAALILGDAVGNHHVAFRRPDWASGSDQDQQMAITSRKMLLDRARSEQMMVLGFHLPAGGIGRVDSDDSGYRFISA